MMPIAIPRVIAAPTVAKASYKSMFWHCLLLKPMALSTPISQKLSFMLALVDVRSKKKASIKAITPTMTEKRVNKERLDSREVFKSKMSKTKLRSSLRYALIPFAM
jgi:hypothetical protein